MKHFLVITVLAILSTGCAFKSKKPLKSYLGANVGVVVGNWGTPKGTYSEAGRTVYEFRKEGEGRKVSQVANYNYATGETTYTPVSRNYSWSCTLLIEADDKTRLIVDQKYKGNCD